jgi:hypothetical protein
MTQLVPLQVAAGDAHGHGGFSGGYNDTYPAVPAATHGSTSCVHQEADQETGDISQHNCVLVPEAVLLA